MGRHGTAQARSRLPWELVGWSAFAGVVAAVAMLVLGEPWTAAVLVVGTGLVAVGAVLALALLASRSGASSGRRRHHP